VRHGALLLLATLGVALVGAMVPACQPNLDDTVSIVTTARVLAIQSSPAEAPPMGSVTYTALVAESGPDAGAPKLLWDYCNARNPLKNLGPVNTVCVHPGSSALSSLGSGLHVFGPIPSLACGNFGPNAPPAVDGGMAGQPVNPDFTGGYYQPVSVFLPQGGGPADTLYFMRLSCGFAGANQASQGTLTARYHLNENPEVASLTAGGKPLMTSAKGATNAVSRGQKLALEVAWPSCPLVDQCGDGVCGADESAMTCPKDCMTPPTSKGCGGAERFVNFDLSSQTVVDQREGMHVSWYATAGTFDQDRTGRAGTDDATTSDDGWTAPQTAGLVDVWIVLRDDRGGIGWAEYVLDVK
jgi:hypothetical protein